MKKYENENNIIEADLGEADVSETPTDGQTEGTTSVASSEKDEDEDIDLSEFNSDSDSFEDSEQDI